MPRPLYRASCDETGMPAKQAAENVSQKRGILPGSPAEDSDDDGVCAICFEEHPFVNLPCSCRTNYCASCWDQSLAASVLVRGRAQCPSCRTNFHIDFDQDRASLVFSKEDTTMSISDWRSRLYNKTRPLSLKLLKDFGPSSSGCANGPSCICGGVLENIDVRTRVARMLDDTRPTWRQQADPESYVDSLASRGILVCDLCSGKMTGTGTVWTCKKGPRTVLHPAAFDVCESCFSQHATSAAHSGDELPRGIDTAARSLEEQESAREVREELVDPDKHPTLDQLTYRIGDLEQQREHALKSMDVKRSSVSSTSPDMAAEVTCALSWCPR